MSSVTDVMPDPTIAPEDRGRAASAWRRPFYWSVRRELWENRSVYLAPLAVGRRSALVGVVLQHRSACRAPRRAQSRSATPGAAPR